MNSFNIARWFNSQFSFISSWFVCWICVCCSFNYLAIQVLWATIVIDIIVNYHYVVRLSSWIMTDICRCCFHLDVHKFSLVFQITLAAWVCNSVNKNKKYFFFHSFDTLENDPIYSKELLSIYSACSTK